MPNNSQPRAPEVPLEIPALDGDHQRLVQDVNALLRAVASQDVSRMQSALAALRSEAEAHFAREEILMHQACYPDHEQHCARHRRLLTELSALRVALDASGRLRIPLAPLGFIRRWFMAHTTRDDRKFATFIDAQGERFLFGLA